MAGPAPLANGGRVMALYSNLDLLRLVPEVAAFIAAPAVVIVAWDQAITVLKKWFDD